MTALSPPLAGRAAAVTLCRTLFTTARIIRQSDRNYRPEVIKQNLFDNFGHMELLDRSPLDAVDRIICRRMGRSMRVRINGFQTRNERAGFWNGTSWKLAATP
jgi:hypothetical protein